MRTQPYYIDKISDTSADTLVALGFARLLSRMLQQPSGKGMVLLDRGSYYEVQAPRPLTENDLYHLKPFALLRPLWTEKQAKEQGEVLDDGFDYPAQQELSKAYYERLRKLPAQYRTPEARLNKRDFPLLADIPEPDPALVHYQAIQQMKIAGSFNDLAQRWIALGSLQREHISLLLALFRQPYNDLSAAIASWQKLAKEHQLKGKACVTQLQIVNPTTGKGSNRPKASTLAEGNPENFWLLELLKFDGFLAAAAPYVVQGGKDRKTYVLQPKVIELSTLQAMMQTFRAVCWSSTAIKLDILASLRFAQVFIKLRQEALGGENEDEIFADEQLYSIAQGFEATFYKDMGSAYAMMNVASLNLPEWISAITTRAQAGQARLLLQEHLMLIQQIRTSKGEEGAEEYELLRLYRDFLSGRDLRPFWRFTAAYSSYLMSQREREKDPRRQIKQLTLDGLENLLAMSTTAEQKQYTTMTRNPGFQRIAYAIRQATVRAQYRRAQLRDRTYEVHYGLGQELMREARYKDKFLVALSHFLHQYNAETAREEEKVANRLARPLTIEDRRAYRLRGAVSYADIDEIVTLIDTFGSETVCSLLVAYGYASEARREVTEADLASSEQTSSADSDVAPNGPLSSVPTHQTDGE